MHVKIESIHMCLRISDVLLWRPAHDTHTYNSSGCRHRKIDDQQESTPCDIVLARTDMELHHVTIGIVNAYPPFTNHIEFAELERIYGPASDVREVPVTKDGQVLGVLKRGIFSVMAMSPDIAKRGIYATAIGMMKSPQVHRNPYYRDPE